METNMFRVANEYIEKGHSNFHHTHTHTHTHTQLATSDFQTELR